MINFFSDDVRRDPFPLYDQIRGTSPLLREPQSGLWMVFDYDGVKRVLEDYEAFSSKHGPDWIIFLDPPRQAKLRALVSMAFTPRSIANMEPRIRELSRGLLDRAIDRAEDSGVIDLAAEFASPLPLMVIADMLGVPQEDRPKFNRWNDAVLAMSYTILVSQAGKEAARAASGDFAAATAEINDYLGVQLAERRSDAAADDLLTRLLRAEVDGQRLTQAEILGFFQLLLVAGQETTSNLINNAVLTLIEHPHELARLRASPQLLPSAIEEVLRYRSPLQWMLRVSTRDIELHGQKLPAGTYILAMIGSANRDPKHFPDPNRFDIARDPNAQIAFGHGIHFCLGAALARLEARIALTELMLRLEHIELAEKEPWTPRAGLHVHGPSRLPIRFRRARSAALTA